MCLCMYVYVYVCTYEYVFKYVYVHIYTNICTHHVFMYVSINIYISKNKRSELKLQIANQHTKHCTESSLYANGSVCKKYLNGRNEGFKIIK